MGNNKKTYRMILIAIFSSLSLVATMIQIPLPTGDMIHLGNFVCILASLLCGGFIGGISGSLGMGMYDLIFYTAFPSTIVRTFLMKFIMGFTAGYLFNIFKKNKIKKEIFLYLFSTLFVLLTIYFSYIVVKNDGVISFTIAGEVASTKQMTFLIPIALSLFSLMLVFSCFYLRKLTDMSKAVLIAVSFSVIINIIGSFVLRIPLDMFIDKVDINTSIIKAITSIPSTVSTGMVSVIFAVVCYYPLYNATKNLNLLNN